MKDHNLVADFEPKEIVVSRRPVLDSHGEVVEGIHCAQITLNNPRELNSYTNEMVKEIILAIREASNDRAAVALVVTGSGNRAFCTGGNTREYAEYYAGRPGEYRQYMRLFNDMVTGVLHCDKPVIARVNGMRVGGGQEIGMACDFSIASDLAVFSQAGPKHGSAPDGGSTDFLPLMVGAERAMYSGTLCQVWSAHRFYWYGGLTQIVPALEVDGEWVANPMVETQQILDSYGRLQIGEPKKGDARDEAKELMAKGKVDLRLLDEAVDDLITKLAYTMPDCLIKTTESIRKHKLMHWDKNRETNRAWLSLNMMTEANAGFRAFHYGPSKEQREPDFLKLRQRLAEGAVWGEELIHEIAPWIPARDEEES